MRLRYVLLAVLAQPPLPPTPAPAPPPEPPPKPVFTYEGKPIVLNVPCGTAEMEQFGLACSAEEPCPLYLELSSVETVLNRIFVAGNLHTESATILGLLLVSEDEGRTWTDATPRMRGAALGEMQFVDLATGYVAGHMAGPLLRDPFFLKTKDGGKTWEKYSVFEESAIGIIESFRFETAAAGEMVINRMQAGTKTGRWQRYETMTGAGTWMLREVSPKPLTLRRSKGASSGDAWRLRADGTIKAYRVEHREGTQWQTVASFAVRAGVCKPDVEN